MAGLTLLLFTGMAAVVSAATYYSQGSLDPGLTSSWNSVRAGGGATPANFTLGDTFVIQLGHQMSTTAAWTVSGSGSFLGIETGGRLTANHLVTAPAFGVDGTYIHNVASAAANGLATEIPGATSRSFSSGSVVEIQRWGTGLGTSPVPLPSVTWGNLRINVATRGGSWQQSGTHQNVLGSLTNLQTGGGTR
jgi:hypothetical protein